MLLLIDLTKAYDRVDRDKLFKILSGRCENDTDFHLFTLIKTLHANQVIVSGRTRTETHMGVAQGSVLSPELFNVYLHEALMSSELLRSLIHESNLLAFADELLCDLWGKARTEATINEFRSLEADWNIRINIKNVK